MNDKFFRKTLLFIWLFIGFTSISYLNSLRNNNSELEYIPIDFRHIVVSSFKLALFITVFLWITDF